MNILVIGGGGREHALAWKLKQSHRVNKIYVAPGNAGTAVDFENVAIDTLDFERLIQFSKDKHVDLVVVGPEKPLSEGIVDIFNEAGIKIFGPRKLESQFESSKDFSKKFFMKHDIPTASYHAISDYDEALNLIEGLDSKIVIKADGLCEGKGVIIAENYKQAEAAFKEIFKENKFGDAGKTVIVEEFLEGVEQSLICFVSNNRIIPMDSAQDYKRAFDGNVGPNTGGVGAYSPSPFFNDAVNQSIEESLVKIEAGLNAGGFQFNGVLFIGFMIDEDEAKVLEFNVRFGDPETEVLLPRLKSDLVQIIEKTIDGTLEPEELVWDRRAAVGIVLYADGYPAYFEKGHVIEAIPTDFTEGELLFHNNTAIKDDRLIINGGRVLTSVGLGDTIEEARAIAYTLAEKITCDHLVYRKDIAL